MQRTNVPERFDQALLKFDAKRFDQTFLKFDGANPCRGKKEKRRRYGKMNGNYVSEKKEIKSEVETALIRDCFLNLFSLDQIPQLRYSANAKYGMSFRCSFVWDDSYKQS
jgi:hypothetical protein